MARSAITSECQTIAARDANQPAVPTAKESELRILTEDFGTSRAS